MPRYLVQTQLLQWFWQFSLHQLLKNTAISSYYDLWFYFMKFEILDQKL
jgi:hypothetical protein